MGRQVWNHGKNIYEGHFLNDERHGFGRFIWDDGEYYVGYWKDGYMSGQGKRVFPYGAVHEGLWKDDQFVG